MVEAVPGRRYRAGRHGHSLSGGHHFDVEKRASRFTFATRRCSMQGRRERLGALPERGAWVAKKWQLRIRCRHSICWCSVDERDIQRKETRWLLTVYTFLLVTSTSLFHDSIPQGTKEARVRSIASHDAAFPAGLRQGTWELTYYVLR